MSAPRDRVKIGVAPERNMFMNHFIIIFVIMITPQSVLGQLATRLGPHGETVLVLSSTAATRTEDGSSHFWAVDALTKLLPDTKPPQASTTVSLEAARGETVSGQAALRPAQAARSLRAETSELRSGQHVIPSRLHPPPVGPLHYRPAQLPGRAAGRAGGEGPLFLAGPVLGKCRD